jgi:ribosomal protein S18 acetylase RimI-like enzyme
VETRQLRIRSAADSDRDAIWNIFHEVVTAGDTYAFDPGMSREEALAYWIGSGMHAYVAEQRAESAGGAVSSRGTATPSPPVSVKDRPIVGTYILRANQAGPGSHVANAAYMVAPDARGLGVGRNMAEHSLSEARRLGFRAMQFNFVVSTNASAIHLWQQLGFKIVGTLPGAFRHPRAGYVDVYVMFRSLLEG